VPIEQSPPQLDFVDLQSEPLKPQDTSITDAYAKELVNQTYWAYELYRTQNHDRRWSTHDSLYFGYVPPRVWDGSNVARAAFTNQIVFDQVEAALPAVVNSLFGIAPDWFSVEAEPGTQPQEAQQIQDALSYILEHPKTVVGSNSISEFTIAIKNILLYGNGGVSVEWDPVAKQPSVQWVDLRDFYVDPGLTVPSVDEARSVIRRKFMTIDEIMQLRSDDRMKIPSNEILFYFAKNVPQAPAEQTKRIQEALRGIYYSPGFSDYLPLPSDQKIEVLIYYSKTRIIWVLNKEWVAYNGPNPYGFIPFCFAPCYVVPGRFYGQSIGDVQENNQRYMEALLNGHLDELTLQLHPPRVQKRSSLITPAQQKWRPGQIFNGDNKDDVSLLQVGNNTVNVFDDIQWMTIASEKRTGINAMGQGSVPSPSNANRTLGGIQAQQGGSSTRLSSIVANIENYLLIPTLYKLFYILQFHTRPGEALPATNSTGHYFIDASLAQRKVQFRMYAASKMVTRDKLMQVIPFWMQALSQGNLMSELSSTGKTVDFDEFIRMMQDATGVSHKYALVRPLTQQEQQAKQQPPPQVVAQQQQAQQEQQTRKDLMGMKVQGELQKEQIKKQPSYWEQQMQQYQAQMDQQARQQELQAEQQKQQQELQQKSIMNAIMIDAKKKQAQMDLQKKAADVQVNIHKSNTERQMAQLDHAQKMQQMIQQMQMQQQQAANTQSISDNYPATNQQQQEQGPQEPSEKRPLKEHGSPKQKAKPPSA